MGVCGLQGTTLVGASREKPEMRTFILPEILAIAGLATPALAYGAAADPKCKRRRPCGQPRVRQGAEDIAIATMIFARRACAARASAKSRTRAAPPAVEEGMLEASARAGAFAFPLVLMSAAGTAQAHTHLKKSVPAAGATVATALTEIRLQFGQSIEANVSQVRVETNAGEPVAAGPAAADPNDKTALVLRLAAPLKAGKVNWRVISADTHKVKGSFSFQVRP